MKLHEYQSKAIFSQNNIPIPKGRVAVTAQEAKYIAEELGGKVVVKAQVLTGGRGKAGGIRLAKTSQEAEELATQVMGMEIKGFPVRRLLIDEAVSIAQEIYLAFTIDRSLRKPVLITSGLGGINVEEAARIHPEEVHTLVIDPLSGLHVYQAHDAAIFLDLPHSHWKAFVEICMGLWKAFLTTDSTLAEINPWVITDDKRLLALDGKLVIDDNALYRHPDLMDLWDIDAENPAEIEARKYGLSYIPLKGSIGCIVNGAGLAMATMDLLTFFGGRPANFLDIGGGASAEKSAAALRLVLGDARVRCVLINIYGGVTRCDEAARGILVALAGLDKNIPIVARFAGTNAREGNYLLSRAHIPTASTLVEAVQQAIAMVEGAEGEHPHQ
ncbi:MAG: ADP-forming succinate--CoA ligase subunit beta [Anaerolineaceae bacterium]|nr:ADP-forming succinate--CoA ligase subunit beta [Anaerolineaceae bacterium]